MKSIWKYINKTNESAQKEASVQSPAEDFSHIYDAVVEKQDELDILYAESVVKEIEAKEEQKAKDCLNKINTIISKAIQQGADAKQMNDLRKRLF